MRKLLAVPLLFFLSLQSKAQLCDQLLVDFSIQGKGDNLTSVSLNIGENAVFKFTGCGLCQYNYYHLTIYPQNGGSATGFKLINGTSTDLSTTSVVFSVPGTYTVELTVRTESKSVFWQCGNEIKKTVKTGYLKVVSNKAPVAQFKTNGAVVTTATAAPNSTVAFTDASTNFPTSWLWSISPSTGWSYSSGNATSQNPSVKFTTNGSYSVTLKATNSIGAGTIPKSNHIVVKTIAPVANFNANGSSAALVSVTQNSVVNFNDLSSNDPTAWSWNISPSGWNYISGSFSSQNPRVQFTAVGSYAVSLTASNTAGSHTKQRTGYIKVTPPDPPVANFSANGASGTQVAVNRAATVSFYDQSSNSPTDFTWAIAPATGWNFLPGSNANSETPKVVFNANGLFTVSLTASNQYGSDVETKTNYIKVSTPGNLVPPPFKHWDHVFTGGNYVRVIRRTSDGGYILGGGSTLQAVGDKTENSRGSTDYWVVKTDANGNKMWDKRFGGAAHDDLSSLQQTADGGYIIGGTTMSLAGGDITQQQRGFVGASNGTTDFWILKLDANGNKVWDKRFGGSQYDELFSVAQTTDGGYILSGNSNSPADNDKSQAPHAATSDYWVVKISASGTKQWDKRFGSTDNEDGGIVIQTSDGGYLVGGSSSGGATGDKSQANQTYWPNERERDYWVVKISATGVKQWDKRFGGQKTNSSNGREMLRSIVQASNGDYLLAGYSNSDATGDVSEPNRSGGIGAPSDYWVVRITSTGAKIWDKRFGGVSSEELYTIKKLADGGFLLGGMSMSPYGGDKTEDNVGPFYPGNPPLNGWLVKINGSGVKQWDKTIETTACSSIEDLIELPGGDIVVAAYARQTADGYKTKTGSGYWMLKMGPALPPAVTAFSPAWGLPGDTITISGTNFNDVDWVRFNGKQGEITERRTDTVIAIVPYGASTGFIGLSNATGSNQSSDTFKIPTPQIMSFSPAAASPGASVRIIGANFQGSHTVLFSGIEGEIISIDSASQVTVKVPDDARTGIVTIISNAGQGSSQLDFTVNSLTANVLQLCPGSSATLTSSRTGTSYRWQQNSGSGFFDIANGGHYAGSTTATLRLSGAPSSWYGYQFRCLVNGNYSNVITLRFSNYWNWLNGVNSSWEVAENWSCGAIPDENTDVVIERGTAVINSNQRVRTLKTKTETSVTVKPGYSLTTSNK